MKITTKSQLTLTKKAEYLTQIITTANVQTLGEQTAHKALKTIYKKSLDEYIGQLLRDYKTDIHKAKQSIEYTFSNGYDLAQLATCFYCQYIGQPLNATANNGELDKQKQPIDIYRACMRTINRYIMQAKNKVYKTLYLQDIDENGELGEYIQIPHKWDIGTKASGIQTHTITDLNKVTQAIKSMNLSATENKILACRLRGYGYDTIAKKMSISKSSVQTYIKRIRTKATAIDLLSKAKTKTA